MSPFFIVLRGLKRDRYPPGPVPNDGWAYVKTALRPSMKRNLEQLRVPAFWDGDPDHPRD